MSPMYTDVGCQKTLHTDFMTEYLRQAQEAELTELKKIIDATFRRQGRPLRILDIGVGDGRVPLRLSGIQEIWDQIEKYDGIENAEDCIHEAQEAIEKRGIDDCVSLLFMDAKDLDTLDEQYDLIITTYFTGGNFIPSAFSFDDAQAQLDLRTNDTFDRIFSRAHEMLLPGGAVVLGSVYRNHPRTRMRQWDFYHKCGMDILTNEDQDFTATRQGFWSQRYSEDRIRQYFHFADQDTIEFIHLDPYEFAMMVVVGK